jgi:kinesin family member C2/C3
LENVICSFNASSVFEQLSSIHLDGLKIELVFQKESSLVDWAENSHFGSSNSLPELGADDTQDLPFYQRNSPEQQWSWPGSVVTEDSDDFDVATSCSSEQDSVRPASAPKPSGFANGATKKTQPKSLKSSDIR